jgi:threonine/homoserine/homoserine lactone efflux protein
MMALLNGFLVGLAMAVSVGPGFIAIFQLTLNKGFRAGFIITMGLFLSDIVLLILSYLWISKLEFIRSVTVQTGIAASFVLIAFGVCSLLKKSDNKLSGRTVKLVNSDIAYFLKGLIINIVNPFAYLYWMGVVSVSLTLYSVKFVDNCLFFSSILATAFVADVLKIHYSCKLKQILNTKSMHWINVCSGFFFILCGIILIMRVLM